MNRLALLVTLVAGVLPRARVKQFAPNRHTDGWGKTFVKSAGVHARPVRPACRRRWGVAIDATDTGLWVDRTNGPASRGCWPQSG